ncbi:DUF7159 family protein [Mycobacterium branderi]|uniref:DUF7159 domain-containing protein n=1 Tax=Mycobacterium branderi TaxID=43348 RepID=A0A7I7W9H1_9MYCO|nr:hypothetical protein [Mycobacterium branderi]MCV7232257.1 hypothetical protein [Mycobacterium branderi]ORA36158.1 hypothetical protein BST20_16545 [Mycobacterium branderi]BBZ14276.1 hypothetical protein MBRA_44710 [Mycobacterium branderi]
MDIVLGVSMAPKTIRMVLVEGENADGVTVEEDNFDTAHSTPDQVIAAILGTREGATEGGYQLRSTGVTWTDPADAAALRDALSARKIENVMLVSAFLAAAALAQTVGQAMGYEQTAMLFVEPETATLAVVDASDGSVTDVRRRPLRSDDVAGELATMVAGLDGVEGLFLVGSGVDVAPIKPALETTTWLPVSAPEEPETALARGAALASANAPLFASSTAALAYAQDPGTGVMNPYYFETLSDGGSGEVAYSAVVDDDADTAVISVDEVRQGRRPVLLVGSILAVVFVTAALALEVALALGIRPTVALLPTPVQRLIEPTEQAPAPPPAASVSEPQPPAAHMAAPAPQPAQVHAVAPPEPLAVPAPPAAPAPAPVPAAPVPAPVPVPVPIHIPVPAPVNVPAPAPVQAPVLQLPINLPAPQPPVRQPTPPVHVPTPPVRQPTPPVQHPSPPVHIPTPPVQQPSPPIHLPAPPAQDPTPPWKLPSSPIHVPTPPVQDPTPPIHLPEPQPPVNMPAPEPPPRLSLPQLPQMPAPQAPSMPAMPAPAMPRLPSLPPPAAPAMPSMPHFSIPSFKF